MRLPISFEEVAYFKNQFRGDLIVTKGAIYYFPHTRVSFARFSDELGGKERMVFFDLLGNFLPILGAVPFFRGVADKTLKLGKFLKRVFLPTINRPQIKKIGLWNLNDTNESLQIKLDEFIENYKKEPLKFEGDSVPKAMRYEINDLENIKFSLKFKFDAKFDTHDFRVNIFHKNKLKKSLKEAGFLK